MTEKNEAEEGNSISLKSPRHMKWDREQFLPFYTCCLMSKKCKFCFLLYLKENYAQCVETNGLVKHNIYQELKQTIMDLDLQITWKHPVLNIICKQLSEETTNLCLQDSISGGALTPASPGLLLAPAPARAHLLPAPARDQLPVPPLNLGHCHSTNCSNVSRLSSSAWLARTKRCFRALLLENFNVLAS